MLQLKNVQFALKRNTVVPELKTLNFVCIFGKTVGNFHVICESLAGIVTSYEDNLLKPKVSKIYKRQIGL